MNHTVFSRCKFDECAEFFNTYNSTFVYFTFFKFVNDHFDDLHCLSDVIFVNTTYRYAAVIFDIDLNVCLFDDLVDNFTLLTNNFTNLCRIDGNLCDLWSVLTNFFTWLCNCRSKHFIDDEFSCFFCSCDCFFYDCTCKTMNLDIHLNCCDTIMCTCNLKVHIAEEVFKTLDICKYKVIIICFTCHKTTGNTCNLFLNWNTCSHKGQCRCTNRCLRCRTIGFKCFGYCTDCIWEFFCAWKYRNQCSFC